MHCDAQHVSNTARAEVVDRWLDSAVRNSADAAEEFARPAPFFFRRDDHSYDQFSSLLSPEEAEWQVRMPGSFGLLRALRDAGNNPVLAAALARVDEDLHRSLDGMFAAVVGASNP